MPPPQPPTDTMTAISLVVQTVFGALSALVTAILFGTTRSGVRARSPVLSVSVLLCLFYTLFAAVLVPATHSTSSLTIQVQVVSSADASADASAGAVPPQYPSVDPATLNGSQALAVQEVPAQVLAAVLGDVRVVIAAPAAVGARVLRTVSLWTLHTVAGMLVVYTLARPACVPVIVHVFFSAIVPVVLSASPPASTRAVVRAISLAWVALFFFTALAAAHLLPTAGYKATFAATAPFLVTTFVRSAVPSLDEEDVSMSCQFLLQCYLLYGSCSGRRQQSDDNDEDGDDSSYGGGGGGGDVERGRPHPRTVARTPTHRNHSTHRGLQLV